MEVTALTLLILHINHLIDTGKYNDISIEDVHHAIESKRVLKFLKERAGNDIDLSVHLNKNTYGDFETYYEEKLNDIYSAYKGYENKKWGVSRLGLCVLLAWTNEIIQQGENLNWSK